MKRLLAILICALMLLSLIPAGILTASAAGEGEWIALRHPNEYPKSDDEPDDHFRPGPGWYYDSEGFHTISPSYKDITPFFAVRRKDATDLNEGLHMEMRVDEFAYKGTDPDTGASLGKDEWISLALWSQQTMEPGATQYGSGWCCLLRGEGNGKAVVESLWTYGKDMETGTGGSCTLVGSVNVDVPMDDQGREIYTLDAVRSGGEYEIRVNGKTIGGMGTINTAMKKVFPDGEVWVSVVGQTGVVGENVSISILDYNGTTPAGSDSKEPEMNYMTFGDMVDSSTIPAGQPCFIWDGSCQVMTRVPETGNNCNMFVKGDNSIHVDATSQLIYFNAGPSNPYTFEAADFPVVTLLLRNFYGMNNGLFYYFVDGIQQAQDDATAAWDLYDDVNEEYELGGDTYNLIMVDMNEVDAARWHGRIHGARLVFGGLTPDDETMGGFDLCWYACFRTVEDAKAFTQAYLSPLMPETQPETVPETQPDAPASTEPVPQTTPADEVPTQEVTEALTKNEETVTAEGGCSSSFAASALLLSCGAALVLRKRKH